MNTNWITRGEDCKTPLSILDAFGSREGSRFQVCIGVQFDRLLVTPLMSGYESNTESTVHYVGIESKAYGVELNFHLVLDATCQFRTPILIK